MNERVVNFIEGEFANRNGVTEDPIRINSSELKS